MKISILIIFLTILTSCSNNKFRGEKQLMTTSKIRKVLLFVPGYYGSTLVEKKSLNTRWVKVSDFFFSQKGIPTTVPGTNIKAYEDLVPGEVLKTVTLLPFIFKIDSYGKTLELLNAFAIENQMSLETVAYDWRDDFISSLVIIDKKIKSLNLSDQDELTVVAHSTGALLMSYYLRYGAQDVDHAIENWEGVQHIKRAILASAPFHGLMVLMRDMEEGTNKGFNKELMSARDYSSFKSSYMFLPPTGEDIGFNFDDHKEIKLSLHDSDTWEKNNWGLFKFIEKDQAASAKKFIQTYMDRSQKFHDLLRAPIKNEPPRKMPLLYTWAHGHPTIQNGFLKKKENSEHVLISFKLKESKIDGDGTVTAESGKPLEFFNKLNLSLHLTEFEHLEIVSSKENQKVIKEFILKN